MTVLLVGAALVVVTGAVATLAPTDPRLGLVGLVACLVAAAFLSDPVPHPGVLAVRLSGALLAVAVLRVGSSGTRGRADHAGRGWGGADDLRRAAPGSHEPHLGWLPVLALAGGGLAAGLALGARLDLLAASSAAASGAIPGGATGTGGDLLSQLGSAAGLSLGLAGLLAAIGVGPALFGPLGPLGLRRAMAAILLVEAVELLRRALAPAPDVAEEVVAALVVATAAATASVLSTRRSPADGLDEPSLEP